MLLLERPPTPEPEALIEEARARQRRRRFGLAIVLVVLAGAGVAAYLTWGHSSLPAIDRVPNGPVVNLSAFAGHGNLAFVSRSTLWVVDGRKLRRMPLVPGYFVPQEPRLSPDGKWLAYLEVSPNGVTPSQLWLAHGDGSGAREVSMPTPEKLVGWRGDELAVIAGPERSRVCPCSSPTTVRLVTSSGSVRTLVHVPSIYNAAWSPSGNALAVAENGQFWARVVTYPIDGGASRVWLSRTAKQPLNGMNGTLVDLAGWWRNGIGIWVFGNGMVHNNDGTPLDLITEPGARPREVAQTLSSGATDAVSAGSRGIAFVITTGDSGRNVFTGKHLVVCSPCHRVGGPETGDPSWSPDGATLAFTTAPNYRFGPWTQRRIEAWFAAHRVHLYNASTGRVTNVPGANGATSLTWSDDGRSLLFVRDDALWLLPSLDGRAERIAGPLYPPKNWPQYFAQVSWATQFSWASR
ncbi:MAG TPA: hypothetical protein VHV52_10630 [Gaiellaceae bacterium]|nr:hypothetical protein [Gaiellaceae bacterium]